MLEFQFVFRLFDLGEGRGARGLCGLLGGQFIAIFFANEDFAAEARENGDEVLEAGGVALDLLLPTRPVEVEETFANIL